MSTERPDTDHGAPLEQVHDPTAARERQETKQEHETDGEVNETGVTRT